MMRSRVITWVVYEGLERGKPSGTYAVCDQTEWDQMEKLRPGEHPLFQTGIGNEGEAERIARATTLIKRAAS